MHSSFYYFCAISSIFKYGEEFLTITEGDEVEAEISADWVDEDGWIAVKKGDETGAVPYDYLEIIDRVSNYV